MNTGITPPPPKNNNNNNNKNNLTPYFEQYFR